jgi:D-alanyl-lipoteichoic acid acyltransferase DltB (MBOAT superfamily)
MTRITASLSRVVSGFWRNDLNSQHPPFWFGAIVAAAGATITALAVKGDWVWLGDSYGFAFLPTPTMLACGGFALFVGGITSILAASQRKIGAWFLIGVAAVTVALASDTVPNFGQSQQTPASIGAPNGPAASPKSRKLLVLKAAQEKPSPDLTSKFVMLMFLSGAVGLVRWSAPARPQTDANLQMRLLAADKPSMSRFVCLEIQLGLLVLLSHQFNLISPLFHHQILLLICFGFLIHYFLPFEYRLPFFLFLSLCAIVSVFGLLDAACLIGVGLVLIGLCHLPVSFRFRVALLVIVGLVLGAFRVGRWHAPWHDAIWPVLASMFMFRLIVYLHSLQHRKAPTDFWSSLSYFFLLPNAVFPLFPVVDYATFHRNYYDQDRHLIHQRGLKWIFWGVTHLLLYRAVYYYMVIGPEDVNSVTDLVRYLVSNFLLILRVSGQFHLVIGVLLLFGFDLPRTMNRYWHAASFTDFWRRANIYWRDFMQRVVFYPIYFRLRHWPATASLLFATIVVFLVTWALHDYQWFWLRGSFSISAPDVLFWSVFGALVAANTVYDAKTAGRKKITAPRQRSFAHIAVHTLRIIGVFSVICLLWSIWISTSLSEWISLWAVPGPTWKDVTVLAPVLLGGVALALWGALVARKEELPRSAPTTSTPLPEKSFFAVALPTGAAILGVLIVSQPAVYGRFGQRFAAIGEELSKEKLSRQDLATLERGYYENLTRVDRFNSQLWERYNKGANQQEEARDELQGRADWIANYMDTGGVLGFVLRPSLGSKDEAFHTNRWGMRDKEYEKQAPPGTCRIALLGGSPEMNKEVPNNKLWEAVLEDRLNRENDHKLVKQYEILNFAMATHTPIQRLAMLEQKALSFQPDVLFYIGHPSDGLKANNRLAELVMSGTTIPYDYLREVVEKAGVRADMPTRELRARLRSYSNEILAGTYHRVVEICRERNIVPVFIYLPNLRALGEEETPDHLRLATEAGFTVLNMNGVFDGVDEQTLHRNDYDFHPNAKGHRIIADRLYEVLRKNPALIQKNQLSRR